MNYDYSSSSDSSQIKTASIAIELLKQNILISKAFGGVCSLYVKMTNGSILVINKNQKYYITKEQFIEDFNLSTFYIYKNLNDVEINQEFHNLRQ